MLVNPYQSADLKDYIEERTHDFTGREWVFENIDQWLSTPDAPRYFIITGEPGIGKTAIAARLCQIRDLDAAHFCITRHSDTIDPLSFTRSISHQLTSIDGFATSILKDKDIHVNIHINIKDNYGKVIGVQIENMITESKSAAIAFNRTVVDPIKSLYAEGYNKQLVILIDALDEAVQHIGPENIVDLLINSQGLPSQVRFVLTSRPDTAIFSQFEQLNIPYLVLDAGRDENLQDIRKYIQSRLENSEILQIRLKENKLQDQVFIDLITTSSLGNFLYLVWLLLAIEEGTQRLDALEALPRGVDGIYREFLRTRIIGKDIQQWRTYYRPVFGVLTAAQAPLRIEQLAQFVEMGEQDIADCLLDIQQFLDPILVKKKKYQMYHQSYTDFLFNKELANEFWIDRLSFHRQIVNNYRSKASTWKEVDWSKIDDYGLLHLVSHLYVLKDFNSYRQELYELICQPYMQEKHARYGSNQSFVSDVEIAIEIARSEKPINLFEEVRMILIYTTLEYIESKMQFHKFLGYYNLEINFPIFFKGRFKFIARQWNIKLLETAVKPIKWIFDEIAIIEGKDFALYAMYKMVEAIDQQINRMLTLVKKIEIEYCKVRSLSEIAKAMAKIGMFDYAQAITGKIEDVYYRVESLSEIVKAMAYLEDKSRTTEIAYRTQAIAEKCEDMSIIEEPINEIVKTITPLKSNLFQMQNLFMQTALLYDLKYFNTFVHNKVKHELDFMHSKVFELENRTLNIFNKIKIDKAKALNKLAEIMIHLGENANAIEISNRAQEIVETIEDEKSKENALGRLGQIIAQTEHPEKTLSVMRDELIAAKEAGLGSVFNTLGIWAPFIATIDQGQILYKIFKVIIEVDNWPCRSK